MSKFVIGCITTGVQDEAALTVALNEIGTWWHWIPNFWLLKTKTVLAPTDVRDKLKTIIPDGRFIIIEHVGTRDWAGVGDPKMYPWLNEHWDTPDDYGLSSFLGMLTPPNPK
jgi:hypothetical protein